MMRAEDDTWDLASSVGATATMVAAARAVTTRTADPLITDPFAEPLVRAVGIDFFARLASGELDPAGSEDAPVLGVQRMTDVMAVRTRYFDEFFAQGAKAGIGQAVILASGLDSRTHRLRWPSGTTVFEIDQPQVIEFKTATLTDLGAGPLADRRVVAIDLRQDWPAALRQAGFDADQPTAWIAEGLLGYLPARCPGSTARPHHRAQRGRFQIRRRRCSEAAPTRASPLPAKDPGAHPELAQSWLRCRYDRHGLPWRANDVAKYLNARGWESSCVTTSELFVANGLRPVDGNDDDRAPFAVAVYVSSTLKQTGR
jgi:methyltransferase (TIGR00027 family)